MLKMTGSCLCPSDAAWPLTKTLSSAYGWGGDSCERAACDASINCANDGMILRSTFRRGQGQLVVDLWTEFLCVCVCVFV